MRTRGARPASLLVRIEAPEAECERLIAELWSLGTSGVEERPLEGPAGHVELRAYFPAPGPPLAALRALASPAHAVTVAEPEPVAERDWEVAWRAGLAPRRIGAF